MVNIRKKFGLPEKENDELSRIIIIDIQGITMGFVVDSVSEVLRVPPDIIEPAPLMTSTIGTEFIKGIAKLEDRLIILLDMDRLLGKAEETALIEAASGSAF